MIRPVVTYSSETWTLTANDENSLRVFERQILRKIFGPVNSDNVLRIRNNMEIDKLIKDTNIVRFIKDKESDGWAMYKEWTTRNPLGHPGLLWETFTFTNTT